MPSAIHEVLVELLRASPVKALAILRELGGVDTMAGVDVSRGRVVDGSVQPQLRTARASDLVLAYPRFDGGVRSLIVEVQQRVRRSKLWAWSLYWAAERERTRGGEVWLIVVTTRSNVARWARAELPAHIPAAGRWLVIGPGTIPRLGALRRATREPEAVVIAGMIYAGHEGDVAIAPRLARACSTLREPQGMIVDDLLRSRLSRAALRAFTEELMKIPAGYVWQSDFTKKHQAKGRTEGRVEGREEGRQEGRVKAQQEMLLAVLKRRRISVDEVSRARIRACADGKQLEAWLLCAIEAKSIKDVFAPGGEGARRRPVRGARGASAKRRTKPAKR
jgi:hypothetical protein